MAGLLCSLGFTSWVAIGALVANVLRPKLPVDTSGCPVNNITDLDLKTSFVNYTWTTTAPSDE